MKSLSLITLLSVLVLTGCAYPYHRGYAGYGGGYGTGYGVSSYSYGYPASVYYRQSTVPSYSYRYSAPRYGHDHGVRHYDWDRAHDRHEANRHNRNSWRGEHYPGGMGAQGRRGYNDRDALWQSVPHANNYGSRRDGGGEHGGGREGGFGRHRGHDGR